MTLLLRAMDFVVQLLPIALTSGVMFLFVSGVKQGELTYGIATATLPMLHDHSAWSQDNALNFVSLSYILYPYSYAESCRCS